MKMYGIKNCDTIKKARKWLEENNLDYEFHDYKKEGLNQSLLQSWVDDLGWEALINKRGTTWRKLPDETKENMTEALAIEVMLDNQSIIKRPLLETDANQRILGFKPEDYENI